MKEQNERSQMRRSDRAVTDEEWIRHFLHRAAVGTMATVAHGQPFVSNNLFVYHEETHAIYLHTARKGRTRSNVEAEERVCFTAFEMGRLLPAEVALEFSVEYSSVVVFGLAAIVEEKREATRALQLLLDKYFGHLKPGRDYRPPVSEELKRTTVFRIDIEEWSGKQKAVGEFPGAFYYGQNVAKSSKTDRIDSERIEERNP